MIEDDPFALARARRQALAEIDIVAGEARMRYITDVPGQQAVYLLKLEEARALLATPPAAAPGPHLAAEAAALGTTPQAVAQAVVELATLWNTVKSPAIEGARLAGKAAVAAAADITLVEAARDAALATLRTL